LAADAVTGRLLTAREVAAQLGATAETVLRWTRAGELPAVRLPGSVRGRLRYRADDINAWIDGHVMGAAPRGVSATHGDRAQVGGYVPLRFPVSATPPLNAAPTEEDH
jgi:excisionase family DNA binding protein